MSHPGEIKEAALLMLAVTLVAALALAILSFSRPLTRSVPVEHTYTHAGGFSYTAEAPDGIYDNGRARTGDPIFRSVTTIVRINFDYQFRTAEPNDIGGSYTLGAEVSDNNGWRRAVELHPEQSFQGTAFTTTGVLDLEKLQALIDQFEEQANLSRQEYKVTITPQVKVSGRLGGQLLQEDFAPILVFRLNDQQLQLAQSDSAPLQPSEPGTLQSIDTKPNTVALLGLKFDVGSARRIALLGLGISMLGIAWFGVGIVKALQGNEVGRIDLKYKPLLVMITESSIDHNGKVIDVATIEDLVRLAERLGTVMLHSVQDDVHQYVVHEHNIAYRYCVTAAGLAASPAGTHVNDAWQERFLEALRSDGRIARACAAADVWLDTAKQARARSPEFARAWDDALASAQRSPKG